MEYDVLEWVGEPEATTAAGSSWSSSSACGRSLPARLVNVVDLELLLLPLPRDTAPTMLRCCFATAPPLPPAPSTAPPSVCRPPPPHLPPTGRRRNHPLLLLLPSSAPATAAAAAARHCFCFSPGTATLDAMNSMHSELRNEFYAF